MDRRVEASSRQRPAMSVRSDEAIKNCKRCNPEHGLPDPTLGSHYHCARCGGESSMYGHYTSFHWATKEKTEGHHCCPGDCALEENRK
jgi:hypothetical protein